MTWADVVGAILLGLVLGIVLARFPEAVDVLNGP